MLYPYVEREGAESTRRTENILSSSWVNAVIAELILALGHFTGFATLGRFLRCVDSGSKTLFLSDFGSNWVQL